MGGRVYKGGGKILRANGKIFRAGNTIPILDLIDSTNVHAWGLTRTREAYAGPAIRVRRNSDWTEQDIYFTSTGALNVAALLAFTGAGSSDRGYITKFYDQNGTADLVMRGSDPTDRNMASIVSSGKYIGFAAFSNGSVNTRAPYSCTIANMFAFNNMWSAVRMRSSFTTSAGVGSGHFLSYGIFATNSGTNAGFCWHGIVSGAGSWGMRHTNSSTTRHLNAAPTDYQLNAGQYFSQIVLQYSTGTKLYLNGKESPLSIASVMTTATNSSPAGTGITSGSSNSQTLTIGGRITTPNDEYFKGRFNTLIIGFSQLSEIDFNLVRRFIDSIY